MALYLTEHDVEQLLTMSEALTALEDAFRRQANGEAINQPRRRLHLPEGTYHTMVAADLGMDRFSIKAYASFRPKTRFLVLHYAANSGDLLAIIEADRLGQMRTGAASGVATRRLARQGKPLRVGIYGTGWQAQSQLEAVCAACEVAQIVAYGRDAARREAFCHHMSAHLGLVVTPAARPEDAARKQDVVITATTAREPVLRGEWLEPGVHVNAVGSNLLMKREVDEATVQRSDLLVVDSIEQSKQEAGNLLPAYERRLFRWEQVIELSDIVSGRRPGRTDDAQITLFKSNGIALEDVAVAEVVYRKALEVNCGVEIPMWAG
ncbi:MAG TPA: ornithine cyclodeaminase family protein [Chthonomonadaceae bacterium]|nr:ornithine cyclodeaminase family protein [Chthonomonadaceae bacterium]